MKASNWKLRIKEVFHHILNFSGFSFPILNNNPSLVVLVGLLCGIIPVVAFPQYSLYKTTLLSFFIVFIILNLLTWKLSKKIVVWCIISIIILFLNGLISQHKPTILSTRNCNAQIMAVTADPELTDIGWLPAPKYVKMKVKEARYNSQQRWIKTSALVIAKLPYGKSHISYGELLKMGGSFIQPPEAPFPGSFDYRKYLKSQGINKIFICSDFKKIRNAGFPFNFYSKIYSVRNSVLKSLCSGIKSIDVRGFLAGFFFGCRQGISSDIKQVFLRSGTIHVLAISGLHVGILALILLFAFRFLPITPRYLLIPLLLCLYVFLTGFRPSGMRALIMISILCFHKAFFYSIRPINSIAFAAVLILLLNPFAIENTGFQFSFIITGFLVLAWNKINSLSVATEEKSRWMIFEETSLVQRIAYNLRKKLFLLIITSVVAGLAGTGLILYYQGLFIPSMVLLNVFILPLLLPLFLIGGVKILTFFAFGTSLFPLNHLLNEIVSAIFSVANLGAYASFTKYLQQPPVIFLLILYFLLAGIFLSNTKKKVLTFIAMSYGALIFWLIFSAFSSGKIDIIQGPGNVPPAVIIKPNSFNNPIVINCPDKLGYAVAEKLKKSGTNCLDSIILTKASKKQCGGTISLLSQVPTKRVIFADKIRKTKLYKTIKNFCHKNNIAMVMCQTKQFLPITIKQTSQNKVFTLNSSGKQINIKQKNIHPGLKKLTISINNKQTASFKIKNSNSIQLFSHSI